MGKLLCVTLERAGSCVDECFHLVEGLRPRHLSERGRRFIRDGHRLRHFDGVELPSVCRRDRAVTTTVVGQHPLAFHTWDCFDPAVADGVHVRQRERVVPSQWLLGAHLRLGVVSALRGDQPDDRPHGILVFVGIVGVEDVGQLRVEPVVIIDGDHPRRFARPVHPLEHREVSDYGVQVDHPVEVHRGDVSQLTPVLKEAHVVELVPQLDADEELLQVLFADAGCCPLLTHEVVFVQVSPIDVAADIDHDVHTEFLPTPASAISNSSPHAGRSISAALNSS